MPQQPRTNNQRPATRGQHGGRRPGAGGKPRNLNALKSGARSTQVQALAAALRLVPQTTDVIRRLTTGGDHRLLGFAEILRRYADLLELQLVGKPSSKEAKIAREQIRQILKKTQSIKPSSAAEGTLDPSRSGFSPAAPIPYVHPNPRSRS